jgi:uncharacterized protein GlcG (DUF336 family)
MPLVIDNKIVGAIGMSGARVCKTAKQPKPVWMR